MTKTKLIEIYNKSDDDLMGACKQILFKDNPELKEFDKNIDRKYMIDRLIKYWLR